MRNKKEILNTSGCGREGNLKENYIKKFGGKSYASMEEIMTAISKRVESQSQNCGEGLVTFKEKS